MLFVHAYVYVCMKVDMYVVIDTQLVSGQADIVEPVMGISNMEEEKESLLH